MKDYCIRPRSTRQAYILSQKVTNYNTIPDPYNGRHMEDSTRYSFGGVVAHVAKERRSSQAGCRRRNME